MEQINGKSFFREWVNIVTERKTEMLSIWRQNKKLTNFVKGSDNSIISELSKKFDLLSYEQD